jgi:hypothetical protein
MAPQIPWTRARIEKNFALIVAAAVNNERCPVGHAHGPIESGAIERLITLGWIRSEVSGRNFRQVFILHGEHAGKKTAGNPGASPVWMINGKHTDQSRYSRPERVHPSSAPPAKTPQKSRHYQSNFEPS